MKLTKDECVILAAFISEYKYEFTNDINADIIDGCFKNLIILEEKLKKAGEDKRREGRTSLNTFFHVIKRFSKKD